MARDWAFRVSAALLSVFLTAVVAETFLAWFRPVPFAISDNMVFVPDPFTGYKLAPNGVGQYQNGIPANANALGFRNREVALTKAPGTRRVLVIGDSFTVGANVRMEEAYPQLLEGLLAERDPAIEVINTAVGGWQPFQYAAFYEHDGRQLAPDLLLVGFFVGNDATSTEASTEDLGGAVMGRRVTPGAATGMLTPLRVFLYRHLHLARLTLTAARPRDVTRRNCSDFPGWYLQIQRARLHDNHRVRSVAQLQKLRNSVAQIARLARLAKSDGVRLVVILLPDENQVNPLLQAAVLQTDDPAGYDFDMPQTLLRGMFARDGIETIDLLSRFRDDPRCLYMNDTHWTPEGHQLAASGIYEALDGRL